MIILTSVTVYMWSSRTWVLYLVLFTRTLAITSLFYNPCLGQIIIFLNLKPWPLIWTLCTNQIQLALLKSHPQKLEKVAISITVSSQELFLQEDTKEKIGWMSTYGESYVGLSLTLWTLTSVYKFSILFSIHFPRWCQGVFLQQSRAS